MRVLISIFVAINLFGTFVIWSLTADTRLFRRSIKDVQEGIDRIKEESSRLLEYRDEKGLSLDKFYLEVYNDIKEVSFYYTASSDIKVPGVKDYVKFEKYFNPSQYKGIRHMDVMCQVSLKGLQDTYFIETLLKVIKNRPIEVIELKTENNNLDLTMRLYGL